jgi:hypothetical protein
MKVWKYQPRNGTKDDPGCKPAKTFRQIAAVEKFSQSGLRF